LAPLDGSSDSMKDLDNDSILELCHVEQDT